MIEVEDELQRFIDAVRDSKTYREYDTARAVLKRDEALMEKVNAYRRKNFEMQNSDETEDLEERLEQYWMDNLELTDEPRVKRFLQAELALCRMLQEVTDRLVGSLNFE